MGVCREDDCKQGCEDRCLKRSRPVASICSRRDAYVFAVIALLSSDYLSVKEVCRMWGEQPLDIAAFRAAEENETTRAAMAARFSRPG